MLVLVAAAGHELWTWMSTGRIAGVQTNVSQDLEGVFFDPSRNPPWLVFGVVVLLVAGRWRDVVRQTGPPGPAWATALLGALAVALVGWARFVSAPDLVIPAFSLGVLALACRTGGAPRLRLFAVPAVLLLFAMPLPGVFVNRVVFPLQMWTSGYAAAVMHALGMPLIQVGDVLLTPAKNFIVVEGCSGMGSIEVLTLLALAYAWYTRTTLLHGALLVLAAPILAYVLNGLRVVTMVLNPDSEIVSIHTTQGLVVFAVGALLIALLDALLGRVLPAAQRRGAEGRGAPGGAPGAAALGLAAAAAIVAVATPRYEVERPFERPHILPEEIAADGSWERQGMRVDERFLGSVGFQRAEFAELEQARSGLPVTIFVGVDDRRHRQRSLWSDKNRLPGAGWTVEDVRDEPLPGRIDSERLLVRNPDGRRITYTAYWNVAGFWEELGRALLGLDQSPFRRDAPSVVLRLATPIKPEAGGEFQARLRVYEAAKVLNPVMLRLVGPDQIRQLR